MRKEFLPYYRPFIDENDIDAVVHCLRNGWLTTGPKVQEFESNFAAITGVKHCIAVNSCTAALKLALVALGVGPGDEVVMPALSFVAGAECVRQLGAEPVFCDVSPDTLAITADAVREVVGNRTKVVIPMHYGGQPLGISKLMDYTRSVGLAVLEDAAHAVGTLDGGKWPGVCSDAAAYSFYATKNITSAEGGMLVTNRDDLASQVRILSLHGMDRDAWKRYMKGGTWKYDVVAAGYKCNLPDLTAALGLSQLKKLEAMQNARDRLATRYLTALKAVPGIRSLGSFTQPPDRHSWCVFAIAVDEEAAGITRDNLIEELRTNNIGSSVHFIPTHRFSAYRDAKHGDMRITERLWRQMLSLPLYPGMTEVDVDDVVRTIQDIIVNSLETVPSREAI
jgi:dTDP-4-amino-4,6-dideoxygalactose transaminase